MIYFGVLAFIIWFGTIQKLNKKAYCILVSICLILLIGLRHHGIGNDSWNYIQIFNGIISSDLSSALESPYYGEKGFIVLNHLVGIFTDNYTILFLLFAFFYIGAISLIIYKFSQLPWFSFFLFITFGFFTFGMTGLRQSLAMTFIFLSIFFILQKKLGLFLLFVGLACTFHLSAIIFLPAYWIYKLQLTKMQQLLLFSFIIAIKVFSITLYSVFNEYARIGYESETTGGNMAFLFICATVALGIYYKKGLIEQNTENLFFLLMLISTISIWPLAQMHPVLFRLMFYYYAFMIILVPNLLESIKKIKIKIYLIFAYIFIGLYFMIFKILLAQYNEYFLPYVFFWEA